MTCRHKHDATPPLSIYGDMMRAPAVQNIAEEEDLPLIMMPPATRCCRFSLPEQSICWRALFVLLFTWRRTRRSCANRCAFEFKDKICRAAAIDARVICGFI